ncbi:origin recognition complex subunit 5 [Exophiala viscosa]|uniref:Origin recognition complex subunit 5 n=1 Tax=Exophiala viscosa TaxID=2486360 RepID=A0AAN6E188_9EURO|nr:origin recognition complex subunit 5 [Exophiala viscosa]
MVPLLPPELLELVSRACPCRENQIRQLATFHNNVFPSPPILVAHGLEGTRKTEVIVNVLREQGIEHAVIKSRECLTQRHLLSKIFACCMSAFAQESQIEQYDRVDSINALLGNLRKLYERAGPKRFVVVLEGIDRLKQPGSTLLPALARLGDQISGLSIILTSNSPRPHILHRTGVPYVYFPPYTRLEAVHIVTSQQPPSPKADNSNIEDEAVSKLYAQFAVTVYDSLISSTASTLLDTFRSTCEKLWPKFLHPMSSGQEPPGTGRNKTWDFAKLLVRSRGLFQADGENALHDTLPRTVHPERAEDVPGTIDTPATPSRRTAGIDDPFSSLPKRLQQEQDLSNQPPLLKHFSTLVLLSAYLASHTAPKHDILLFSRLSSSSSNTSKKIRRLRQTPTKKKAAAMSDGTPSKAGTPGKSRSKSVFAATATLGIPRPFTLERILAILRAVHPHGIPNRPGHVVSDRVYRELGELEKLRLVVRTSGSSLAAGAAGTMGGAGTDDLTEEKWRVNVSRDWVVSMGQIWGMGISEYEVENEL